MNSPFYRIWLPISVAAHLLLVLLLHIVPFSAPRLGHNWIMEVDVLEAAQPAPPAPVPPEEPPAATPAPDIAPEPDSTAPTRDTAVPRGRQLAQPGITLGTGTGNTRGTPSTQPGPGAGPSAPPAVMTSPTGANPGVPKGVPGGTGTQGSDPGPGGPSRGGRAKFGRMDGSDKLAGEINRNGTAVVLVQLDAAGAVTGVTLARGTGEDDLDAIALRRVRACDFAPALHNGTPVAGSVRMQVEFHSGQFTIEEVK